MDEPPLTLDGARVITWAVAPHGTDFGQIDNPETGCPDIVVAMAICTYDDPSPFYVFRCDSTWEVVFDWDADTVDDAKALAVRLGETELEWHVRSQRTV